MPLNMEEYEYLREGIEQVQGLTGLAKAQLETEETSPQSGNAMSVFLTALDRACDDAIADADGAVEVPL
ncbi:hypothetical protein [Roseovarius aestuarii]|uniref:Uncharacterized protein n=1 Tax=Roseovarius aestuarii TaxID=475083 RepID=A0A1X7BVT4_9RHOB|nr:hypothetical protein [Roseovarius aestuarii]SMC13723.1 hypothetical protein ROA7745_03582 [Roseovarius aestuarii]